MSLGKQWRLALAMLDQHPNEVAIYSASEDASEFLRMVVETACRATGRPMDHIKFRVATNRVLSTTERNPS